MSQSSEQHRLLGGQRGQHGLLQRLKEDKMLSKQAKIKPAPVPEVGASPGAAPEGEAGQEAPKKGKTSPEALKKGKASPEGPKKEEARQEAPKKEEARQETLKKEEARQETPKKEEARHETLKKEEARHETLKKEEARQEAPKKGEAPLESPKKEEARQESPKKGEVLPEASKKGEAPPESLKKEEARQESPKKGEVLPEAPKKGEATQEAPKKGEASQETPQEGEASQEAHKKPVFPFGKVPFRPHHWRLVTFILGACSLILLIVLLGLIGNYLQVLEATRRKMATLQRQNEKLKDSVRQQAGGKGSRCDPCLDEWVQRGDACYLFSTLHAKWPECVKHCQTKGAKLVKMESQGELVFLKRQTLKFYLSQFRYRRYYNYWIGLTYKATLKKWVWLDESPFTLALQSLGLGIVSNVNDLCVFFTHGKSHVKDCSMKHRCLCKKNK